ncbi:peptidylprolyl isomerase [Sneathiella limimaris]|uniref:peptidylprolyl isomerase n=1 Tax=Sneathiella limimaris TaxID=1964213 RepID=UPI001469B6B4|nr:peptidylprolyl isomerase [Sneathiella limimaris]
MKRIQPLLIGMLLFMGSFLPAQTAAAQEVQKIVAIVNDDVISGYDVIQRINLNIFMAGLPANNQTRQRLVPTVIRTLIDDQLKIQEAKRLNTEPTDAEINAAIENFEKRFNIRSGQFEGAMRSVRVDPETVVHQIRAALGWDKLIRRRIVPRINVTEAEIQAMQDRLRENKGKNEYLLREIFLPIAVQSEEPDVRKTAEDLSSKLKSGADFSRVATQFSDGPTAAKGGIVGWQMASEMPTAIAQTVVNLDDGSVSDPIRTNDGYYLVKVEQVRKILEDGGSDAILDLGQLVLPIDAAKKAGEVESQVQLAKSVSGFIDDCSYIDELYNEFTNGETGRMGQVQLSKLPSHIKTLVSDLQKGQASEPYLDKNLYRIFVVCERVDRNQQGDSEEAIRQTIGNERIESRARRYLNDLRREASIESR